MKYIRLIKANQHIQSKIEELLEIINRGDLSEFEGYKNPEVLQKRAKIDHLEEIINQLEKITKIDEIAKKEFEKYKKEDDYENAEDQFKVILNKAENEKVSLILDKNLK